MNIVMYLFICLLLGEAGSAATFIEDFVAKHPQWEQSKLELAKLENQIKEVRGGLFPSINWQSSENRLDNFAPFPGSITLYSTKLELTQPIYTGGKLFTAIDLARQELLIAQIQHQLLREQLKLQAYSYLLRLRNQKEKIRIAKDQLQIQERNLSIVRNKSRLGNTKEYELPQAEADSLARQIQLEQLEIEKTKLVEEIRSYVNHWQEEKAEEELALLEGEKFVQQQDLSQNLELQILRLQQQSLAIRNRIDLAVDYPNVALVASGGYQSLDGSQLFRDENQSSSILLTATVPLFSGLSSVFKRRAQQQSLGVVERQILDKERELKLSQTQLLEELKRKKQLLKTYKQWRDLALRSLSEAQKSYRSGRINFLQVTQVQQSLDNANSSYWDTWLDFYSKSLQLSLTQGSAL